MDTGVYEQKVTRMISDDKTYEEPNKDPTPKQQEIGVHHKEAERGEHDHR